MAKDQNSKASEVSTDVKDKYIDSETVVFYGSWFKALEGETISVRCKFYEIVIKYGCFKIEPEKEDIASHRILWKIIKGIIDKDKKKRKDRIESSRKRIKKYRENQKNKNSDVTRTHVTNGYPIYNYEIEPETEGEIDTENENANGHESVSVNEPGYNVNPTDVDLHVVKNNNTSSSFNNNIYEKDDGGDDGNSPFVNKEKIFKYCIAKGIDPDWLEDMYAQLEAQNFTVGKKPITSLTKYIESKWEKAKALKDAERQEVQKKKDENIAKQRMSERKRVLAEYTPPKEHLDKWSEVWRVMKADGKTESFNFWHCSLMFRNLDEESKRLYLVVPNDFYFSEFERRYKDEVAPYIQEVFGNVEIHYLNDNELFLLLNGKISK